jgi:uncharacterized damage-inducible protein DinB
MLRKIEDFLNIWKYESEATLKVLRCITDEALNKKIHGYERTLGFLAWHITAWTGEMGKKMGLIIDCPPYDSEQPDNISQITAIYKKTADSLLDEIKSKWTDDFLLVKNDMYGKIWENGRTLDSIVRHQTHHRGQVTVLLRILGLPVTGVYGPSKEEWVNFGMEPQK